MRKNGLKNCRHIKVEGNDKQVLKEKITFANSPTKFEAGTMQTADVVAFSESIKFIEDLGIKNIKRSRE